MEKNYTIIEIMGWAAGSSTGTVDTLHGATDVLARH